MFSNIFRASETLFKNCRGMRLKKDADFLFPGGCRQNKALPNKPSRLQTLSNLPQAAFSSFANIIIRRDFMPPLLNS